jgi:hypothetical protein
MFGRSRELRWHHFLLDGIEQDFLMERFVICALHGTGKVRAPVVESVNV